VNRPAGSRAAALVVTKAFLVLGSEVLIGRGMAAERQAIP
jgi:hypothetical protein